MSPMHIARRTAALSALAIASLLAAACGDSTAPDDHEEPEIAGVTISAASGSVATGSVTLSSAGQSGALTLRAGTANALTVRVLDLAGQDEAVVLEHPDEFEIRVYQGTTLVATSTSAYPYTVSLTPAQSGSATYSVRVYAIEHGHEEFALPVVLAVAAP